MCIRTGIKDVYQGVQGVCPRRAVTCAKGTAEHHAVGMGLRLMTTEGRRGKQSVYIYEVSGM